MTIDALWRDFSEPADEARPRVWWHWMDGNIDPDGIVRDLSWMHEVGVRGVQLFDGGMGVPLVVPEAVRPGSAVWTRAIDTAVSTADDLGLELAVATSSGWSAAGGPWVAPQDAMKKIVWSETSVEGGAPVELQLGDLPSVRGPYQDAPRWGGSGEPDYAVDWRVVAVPHRRDFDILRPTSISASAVLQETEPLTDGSFAASVPLPRDPDEYSSAWIEQSFDDAVTVRSIVVGLPGPRGFGAAPAPDAALQASDDGVTWRDVVTVEPTSAPVRSASFAPVTARRFRLVLSGRSAADALPPVADGVRLPPVLRRSAEFRVSEFALRTDGRVHAAEAKAGFSVLTDYYEADTDPAADSGAVDPEEVIDLTGLAAGGTLRWDAPPGYWRVLRLGASLTGQTNGPALADSTGLEVDKLDGARVAEYLQTHLDRFCDQTRDCTSRFGALLSDSIESGAQNWTDRIVEHFAQRRGYDPVPWLPTLTGMLIGSADRSDRFLYDYRRTLSEVFADQYYGTLASEAHRRGMTYYAEALEDGRPQLGDDLAMRSHVDVPMGAMWTFEPDEGPRPTYVADLKGAASVAHVYGKQWVGSEAFTSFGKPWSWSPQALKHVADLQLSLGVTRFCIHTSPHQPLAAPPPGIALAPFLGQAFTVNETWSNMARPWIDYLARCSALLSSGRPAVDIAVFVGEEAPVTGLFDAGFDRTVPDGFDFDYIGADALAGVLRVENGILTADGADYRILFLGGSSQRMTLAALLAVERLLDAGATVVGSRPRSSPSLADDPAAFAAVCDRLWADGRIRESSLGDALSDLGMKPDLEISGAPVRRIARRIDGTLVTFLANPSPSASRLRIRAADGRALARWDPVSGQRVALDLEALGGADGGHHIVDLAPFGSLFVLEDPDAAAEVARTEVVLDGSWSVQIAGGELITVSPNPRMWTELGDAGARFSGTAVYRHDFSLSVEDASAQSVLLDLCAVGDIARVFVNGEDCGIAWTAPFRLDITAAVRGGDNSLEVHVATPWRNRLIAESASPTGDIFAPMTQVFNSGAAPQAAGLSGPVRVLIAL